MALIIVRSLKSSANRTSSIVKNEVFFKLMRFSTQSITGQLPAILTQQWKLVAQYLDLPTDMSRRIVLKSKIMQKISVPQLEQMAAIFKEIQVVPKKLMEHPEMLSYYPVQIEQRYHCLKELGLQPINVPEILRFSTLIKRNAYDLKLMELMPNDVNPLDHLLCQVPFLKLDFLKKYNNLRNMSLKNIRKIVLVELLSQMLDCQRNEAIQLLQTYSVLRNRSVTFHRATIELLVDTLGFSVNKLKSSKYLLTIHPRNIENVISSIPYVGGQSIQSVIQRHPKLLFVSADQVLKTNEYLKQSEISDEQIANCYRIFFLKTDVVQQRLKKIITTGQVANSKTHPRMLSCVSNLNNARQPYLSSRVPKTINVEEAYTNKQNIAYIAKQLDLDADLIKIQLMRHPRLYLNQVCNCRSVMDHLFQAGFDKVQISNAMHLVLYNLDTIKTNLEDLPLHKDIELFGDWKTNPYILQLMLYEIEKNILGPKKGVQNTQISKEAPKTSQFADLSENAGILNCQAESAIANVFDNSGIDNVENVIFWD